MSNKIKLPALPAFEGDNSPDIKDFNTKRITRAELRARDLEVARVVLEGAALAAGPEDSYRDDWFNAKAHSEKRVRALEVKHYE